MKLRMSILALAVALPAAAQADFDYRSLIIQANASPEKAKSLYLQHCYKGAPTPQYVCNRIRTIIKQSMPAVPLL